MTNEQKRLITESFHALGPSADNAAALFYRRLFLLDPSLRALFQGDMAAQRTKLMETLAVAVDSLARLDHLVPALWALGKRHGGYGVQDAHYETVKSALLWALERQLGPSVFTASHQTAWMEVYDLMAAIMKQAAREGIVPRPDGIDRTSA